MLDGRSSSFIFIQGKSITFACVPISAIIIFEFDEFEYSDASIRNIQYLVTLKYGLVGSTEYGNFFQEKFET